MVKVKAKPVLKVKTGGRRNPRNASDEMFQSFHGHPSDETVEYRDEEHYHSNLAALGTLVEFKVKLVGGSTAVIGFEGGDGEEAENPKKKKSNPFWPFNSFTKTTIYHVGTGDKYSTVGKHKGLTIYKDKKADHFLVPAIERESHFDTKRDATRFIDAYKKSNPGPFREAGKLVGSVTGAVSKPLNDFTGTAGKVGGYLDNQLGKALSKKRSKRNPGAKDTGPVFLTSNESGTQLYIIGGDQSLDLSSLGITGREADKELITIGDIKTVCYHAVKIFDGKEEEFDYVHKLGEDGGELPTLIYDRMNQQLKISGGSYFINRPLTGTSPGIEN